MKTHHRMELVAWTLVLAAVTSCTHVAGLSESGEGASTTPQPATESRPAIIQLTERDLRDARGRFVIPVHRVTGEPASTQQTIYRTATAAEMHGPVYRLKPAAVDHAEATEIPRLTD